MIEGLSTVTIVWSMIAAGAVLLGIVHLVRWALDRESRVDLTFALVAFCFAGVAFGELAAMHAGTPAEWGAALRWLHLPLWGLVVSTVAFVHQYLGTGRLWLLGTMVGLRTGILALNFAAESNFNFAEIHSIERVWFLGERVTVVGEAVTGRFQFLGLIASVLLIAYVLDAALVLWRRGGTEDRRRAVTIGGSLCAFVLIASVCSQLVIWQVAELPFFVTPAFAVPLLAMSFEQGRDLLLASRLARELRDTRWRLELAAGAADLGLWEWNGRTGKVWATGQAREIFGLIGANDSDYRAWLDRVHPDDLPRLRREMERALASGSECTSEFRVLPGGKEPRWILARGRADAGSPGTPAQVRGVLRDVSDERRAHHETQELRRELAHAGRVSLLGQLSSSLAHELSQPLGAIQRNAEAAGMVLKASVPDREELEEIVTDILRDDQRARDIVDRLRTMLKRRAPDFQPIAPDTLVQDVLALARADAASRGVTLECPSCPALPPVSGDRVQLSQVLLNLVLNAMDAVAGQPASRRTVIVAAQRGTDGAVEIRVSDSGPGIAEEHARRIFEPFFTSKSSGMGLGLSISRSIAEAHGGSLTACNDESGGACFRLVLPAQEETRP